MWEELRNLMHLVKQGPQGPQKLSSLKSLEIQITPNDTRALSLLQSTEMTFLTNYRWQNRIARPNRSTNNRDMVEKVKCEVLK